MKLVELPEAVLCLAKMTQMVGFWRQNHEGDELRQHPQIEKKQFEHTKGCPRADGLCCEHSQQSSQKTRHHRQSTCAASKKSPQSTAQEAITNQ